MTTMNMGEEGFRWFLGIVEDVSDPLQLGRVKVRVLNEYDEGITTDDIEWAHVMLPTTSGTVQGVGDTPNLAVGSNVIGFFLDSHEKQIMMILGSYPTIPDMDDTKHAISYLARGKQSIQKEPVGPEPASSYAAQYPFNRVIQTRSGHVIELDDTPENTRIHIYHNSGAYIEINNDGRMVIKSSSDRIDVVDGELQIYATNDITLKTDGKVLIDSANVNITGDLTVDGEVTGKGIKLSTHVHGGVQTGGSTTLKPS